jgi:hypothetical protein
MAGRLVGKINELVFLKVVESMLFFHPRNFVGAQDIVKVYLLKIPNTGTVTHSGRSIRFAGTKAISAKGTIFTIEKVQCPWRYKSAS